MAIGANEEDQMHYVLAIAGGWACLIILAVAFFMTAHRGPRE